MSSARFLALTSQLSALRNHLLPDPFEVTGVYADQERVATSALAYRVLAHAEIESYMEDRALEAVNAARVAWEKHGHVSRVALCLVAFCGKEMALPPDSLEAPNENKRKVWPALVNIGERLSPVLSAFYHRVRNENHGVKEKNLLALLLPIGVDHSKLDPAFLTEIDSFGSLRGVAAHSSSSTAVQQAIDPAEELKRVAALLPGIEAIDALIEELVSAIPSPPQAATA